jgi:hypothetical protein
VSLLVLNEDDRGPGIDENMELALTRCKRRDLSASDGAVT